jgi:AbrB family looped-hinge helix DNA binding protein
MGNGSSEMKRLTLGVDGVSAKIRILGAAGYERADIARFLGKRYQHVRNVLEAEKAKASPPATRDQRYDESPTGKVRVGPDGRIVIPSSMREALSIKENDVLFARVEDGELHLSTASRMQLRVNDALREFIPAGVSLVDELIEERRREAERDARTNER